MPRSGLLLAVGFGIALAAAGCGSREAPAPARCPPPRSCPGEADAGRADDRPPVAAASDAAAAATDAGLDPLPPGPGLAAAVRGFTTVEACVATLAQALPPELTRETDGENLPRRVCETRRALAERNPARCDELPVAGWASGCRRLYAALHGQPDQCPERLPRSRGRDPGCVALASRDPSLCRAVTESEAAQLRCFAVLGPEATCRRIGEPGDVEACLRDRARWRALLTPGKAAVAPTFAPGFALAATLPAGALGMASAALRRGLVVPDGIEVGGRFQVGDLAEEPAGDRPARLRVAVDLPRPRTVPQTFTLGSGAEGARLCAVLDGKPVRPRAVTGTLVLQHYGPRRGAVVSGHLEAQLDLDGTRVPLTARFETFVRDVVPAAWAEASCEELLPPAAAAEPAARRPPGDADDDGPDALPCAFVAHWDGPRRIGYRVYALRPAGACARIGLRDGDVVRAVDGRPLAGWSDVRALYRALSGSRSPKLSVLRQGRPLDLPEPPRPARP